MPGSDTLIDLGLSLLAILAPVLASVLTGILVRQLQTWGLTLESEQEAKIQAKIKELILAIEEQSRREQKLAAAGTKALGATPPAGAASLAAATFEDRVRTRQAQLVHSALEDPALKHLSAPEIIRRGDAVLTKMRQVQGA